LRSTPEGHGGAWPRAALRTRLDGERLGLDLRVTMGTSNHGCCSAVSTEEKTLCRPPLEVGKLAFTAEADVPILYMQQTRDYDLAVGYGNQYRWTHFVA
jgi:hypothetical protein